MGWVLAEIGLDVLGGIGCKGKRVRSEVVDGEYSGVLSASYGIREFAEVDCASCEDRLYVFNSLICGRGLRYKVDVDALDSFEVEFVAKVVKEFIRHLQRVGIILIDNDVVQRLADVLSGDDGDVWG